MPISRAVFESVESEDIDNKIFCFLKQNNDQAFTIIEISNLLMLSKKIVKDEHSLSNEILYAIARLTDKGTIRFKLFGQVVFYSV